MGNGEALVTAAELETRAILKKGTAYRMARAGLIPAYSCGTKARGVRFRVEEVLAALRRPACAIRDERSSHE